MTYKGFNTQNCKQVATMYCYPSTGMKHDMLCQVQRPHAQQQLLSQRPLSTNSLKLLHSSFAAMCVNVLRKHIQSTYNALNMLSQQRSHRSLSTHNPPTCVVT